MVLSNKKLKQKLRAAKVEHLAAAEALNNTSGKDFEKLGNAYSKESYSLKIVINSEAKRDKLSKREKRRQNAEQNTDIVKQRQIASGVEEKVGDELKSSGGDKKKKRKRDESQAAEKVKEEKPEQPKKKKKHKHKRKPKKNVENRQLKEEANKQNGSQASQEQLVAEACPNADRKELEPSTKVYVGGIPYYSTEDDIRSYFESCGTITNVDCMEFPDTGKFRGIAIITFKTEAAAKRALAFDGSDMGGLFLKIQPFKSARAVNKLSNFSPTVVEGYNRIYIGNLSWDVTEDDLRELFSDCSITSIRFGEDKETGEFKGYAHVDFADSPSLNIALKLDQSIVCGRHVRISCAVQKEGTVSKLKSANKNHIDGDKVRAASKYQDISSAKIRAIRKDQENSSTIKVSAVSRDQENNSTNVTADSEYPENSSVKVSVVGKDQTNSCIKVTANSKGHEDNTEVTTPVSSKIRRRMCYECGEKGHISSCCPKKAADAANPSAA